MNRWGIEGAMHWFQPAEDLRICDLADDEPGVPRSRKPGGGQLGPAASQADHRDAIKFGPDPSSIVMATGNPVWLLGNGWYPLESGFRWMHPDATARLRRPPAPVSSFCESTSVPSSSTIRDRSRWRSS